MGSRRTKIIAAVAAVTLVATLSGPTVVGALLEGRGQPEECDQIVEDFVATLQSYIDAVDDMTAEELQGAQSIDALFSAQVPSYQRRLADARCDEAEVRAALANELDRLRWYGPVASMVGPIIKGVALGQETEPLSEVTIDPSDDLSAAAVIAPAGTTLRLTQGEHRVTSSLVFEGDAAIVGAGAGETTIVSEAAEFAVLYAGGGTLRLNDLTIARDTDAPGSVLVVSSGGYDLRGLEVRGGVAGTDGGGGAGIALGTEDAPDDVSAPRRLDGVEVRDNAGAGIAVSAGHAPELVDVVAAGNGRCGVCFLTDSAGTLTDSRVAGNETGVAVAGTSRPRVVRTVVEDNLQVGIVFEGEAAGAVRDSVVRGNGDIGLLVSDDAAPVLRDNDVSGHSEAGVAYRDAATGLLDGNDLFAQPVGVWVEGTAAPRIERNVVTDSDVGLVFTASSTAEADGNRMEGLLLGVEVREQSAPVITGSTIEGSEEVAMLFRDDATGRAQGNTCVDSDWLALIDASEPTLEDNDCDVVDQR